MRGWGEDPKKKARERNSKALVPTTAAVAEGYAREAELKKAFGGAGSKVELVTVWDLLDQTQNRTAAVAEGNVQDATEAVVEGSAQDTTAAVAEGQAAVTEEGGAEGRAAGAAAASNASSARSSGAQNEGGRAASPEEGDFDGSDENSYTYYSVSPERQPAAVAGTMDVDLEDSGPEAEEEIQERRVEDVSQTEARLKEKRQAVQDKIDEAQERACEARRRKEAKREQPMRGRSGRRATSRSRTRRRQRTRSDRNRSRGRQKRSRSFGPCKQASETHIQLQEDLERRGPINSAAFDGARNVVLKSPGELPASVGQGNLMVANWLISKKCDPNEMAQKLRWAPFDCIVVVLSTAVAESDLIMQFFKDLADRNPYNSGFLDEVLQEKSVHRLFGKTFVALHRAKVCCCHYALWQIRNRGDDDIEFGTLELVMDNSRQRMGRIKIGIIDMRGMIVYNKDIAEMIRWLVLDRVALLTGYFPNSTDFLQKLAKGAKAIHWQPLCQGVRTWNRSSGDWWEVCPTTYFILFGYYRSITVPHASCVTFPRTWSIGQDLWDELIPMDELPSWTENHEGSVFVPNLGNIKMKDVDFSRWFQGSIQTCLWLGTATPRYKSQNRSREKGKGKGKDKGKGKGKGKGMKNAKAR